MTIPRFSDHAANERTFLAWVRTAIAVMAFGFLVERFDIFLDVASNSLGRPIAAYGNVASSVVGLALIIAGSAMVMAAMLRFVHNRKAIANEAPSTTENVRLDLALAGLIVVLGLALAIYIGMTMLHGTHSG